MNKVTGKTVAIIALLVINIALTLSLVEAFGQLKKYGNENESVFLNKKLQLNESQKQSLNTLREKHFFNASYKLNEINKLREKLHINLLANSTDTSSVRTITAEIGTLNGELEVLTYFHLLEIKSTLTAKQQENFRELLNEFINDSKSR